MSHRLRVLIAGVGNLFLGDDAAGPVAVLFTKTYGRVPAPRLTALDPRLLEVDEVGRHERLARLKRRVARRAGTNVGGITTVCARHPTGCVNE